MKRQAALKRKFQANHSISSRPLKKLKKYGRFAVETMMAVIILSLALDRKNRFIFYKSAALMNGLIIETSFNSFQFGTPAVYSSFLTLDLGNSGSRL